MPLRIMVVDDEPEILKAIKTTVEPLGVEVLTLPDSRQALRRLRNERFEGFLVDASMPEVDGFELTQAIRKSSSSATAPIVMIADSNDVQTMRKAFQVGISIFLTKPLNPERLAGLIRVLRGPMLTEKRRRCRLPLRTPVHYKIGSHQYQAASLNIGEGGLLIEAAAELEVGQEVEVEFALPGSSSLLKPRGTVLRKEAGGRVAIRFSNFSSDDLAAIRQYIFGAVKD